MEIILFRQSHANSDKVTCTRVGNCEAFSNAVRHATMYCDVTYNGHSFPFFRMEVV